MAHLVFIPSPGAGHFYSAVELAKLLVEREHRLSVSILIITPPASLKVQSFTASETQDRIRYVHLSHDGWVPGPTKVAGISFSEFIDYHKPQVRDFLTESTRTSRLAGVVLDMFCMTMTDVADEFGVPSYMFYASGAGFLCLAFHALDEDLSRFKDSDSELAIPGFSNSFPAKALPSAFTGGNWSEIFMSSGAKFRHLKGILVNTFYELQSHAITHLSESDTVPPIYPVGPLLNLKGVSDSRSDSIIRWLDKQPQSSVVFLCFGSTGSFGTDQVVEISRALENSRARFLWSLRQPPAKGQVALPGDYGDVLEALPVGFLERTSEIGKVIGWAPQVAVLSHPAVGGFVSHCGWNSTLESIWFGVPVATWPLSGDQQSNAFEIVKEWGVGVEVKLDYTNDFGAEANYLVTADEIEYAIKQLMEANNNDDSLIKQKVKNMSTKSMIAVANGGSSYVYLDRFIEEVISNTSSK